MFKLDVKPTFESDVKIHVPGQTKPETIRFVFNHVTREKFAELLDSKDDDVDMILKIASDWKGVQYNGENIPFNRENVALLVSGFHAAARAIYDEFVTELHGAARKN